MNRTLRWAATTLAAVTAATTLTATPAAAATYSAPLRTAVASLPVAAEVRTGYSRDLFPHWIDADGDGCNTRYEVLIAEAVTKPSVGSGCSLSGGRWYSYYDNAYWTQPADLDIDHMVPLAEAWDSGARNWTTSHLTSIGASRSTCPGNSSSTSAGYWPLNAAPWGTRTGTQALTCSYQALMVLVWFREDLALPAPGSVYRGPPRTATATKSSPS